MHGPVTMLCTLKSAKAGRGRGGIERQNISPVFAPRSLCPRMHWETLKHASSVCDTEPHNRFLRAGPLQQH